jgi:transcription antitermination factor NusG
MGEACLIDSMSRSPALASYATSWFAIQTGYRYEQRVATDLSTKGFSTYLPMIQVKSDAVDYQKSAPVAAFSGYLFVNFEPTLRNRVRVLETRGILRLLGGNNTPIPVPDEEIQAVRQTLECGVACERCALPAPGDLVRVVRGPLAGVCGQLLRVKNSTRVVIAVSSLAQAISADVALDDITVLTNVA